MNTPDWAGIKRRQRGHAAGDHSQCDYRRCRQRQQIELDNDARLLIIATFDELKKRGINSLQYFGADKLKEKLMLIATESPEWLDTKPDFVHRLQAKINVDEHAGTEKDTSHPAYCSTG